MSNYWSERIEKEMLAKQAQDKQIGDELKRLHQYHMRNIQLEIDSFLAQYGVDNQLSPAEVKKKVAAMDVVAFQEKAKRYVAEKNFSERANAELSLYNLKMNVSRLEMLQHHLDLEMVALADGEHKLTEKFLNQEFIQEMNLQAGILGEVTAQPRLIEGMAQSIINTPYHNAVWSDKIWQRQDRLRKEIARMVDITLLRGRNATTLVPEFRRLFDVGAYEAKRLAVTETARIQTAVQKEMYAVNEIEAYEYMAEPSACDVCAKLDGKSFKVAEMTPGKNAAPMHPHCHCSTGPSVSKVRKELDRKLGKDEEVDLSRLFRNKDKAKRRTINLAKQNKLTKEFRKRGGIVWQDDEAERYLFSRNASAMNLDEKTIVLQKKPTISEILEELYHAEQYRRGTLDPNDVISKVNAEIEAQHYLLSVEKRYNIPKEEIEQTKKNLKYWQKELNKYENR